MRILFLNPETYINFEDDATNYSLRLPILNCGVVTEYQDFVYQRVLRQEGRQAMNHKAIQAALDFQPDLVVHGTTWLSECLEGSTLQTIMSYGIPVFTQIFDSSPDGLLSPYEVSWIINCNYLAVHDSIANLYQYRSLAARFPHLKSVIFTNGNHLFTDIFRKKDLEKKYEVSLIGSNNGLRAELLKYLRVELSKHNITLSKFGGLVDTDKGDPTQGLTDNHISWDDYIDLINSSKICLSSQNIQGYKQIKGRVFEYLACGTFCLSDANSNLKNLIPEGCIAYFNSFEDCLNKIIYYLEHEEERNQIVDRGYQWFHQTFNYKKFWSGVLNAIQDNDIDRLNKLGTPPLKPEVIDWYKSTYSLDISHAYTVVDQVPLQQRDWVTPASALWQQRQQVIESRDRLQILFDAVAQPHMATLAQWQQWYAVALDLQPDLILEIGRDWGSCTTLLTEAAQHISVCRVVSLCPSVQWKAVTQPQLVQVVEPSWFERLDAQMVDIATVDIAALLGTHQRILVFWRDPSYKTAEFVLAEVLPHLRDRQHLIIIPAVSDNRYAAIPASYEDSGIWNGKGNTKNRLILKHLCSSSQMFVPLLDFAARNELTIHSADHSFLTDIDANQMVDLINDQKDLPWHNAHWAWFSLNERGRYEMMHFPRFTDATWVAPADPTPAPSTPSAEYVAELETQLKLAQTTITAMKTSKFWKFRSAWLRLKAALGRSQSPI